MNPANIMKLAGQIMRGDLSGTIEAFKEPVMKMNAWQEDLRKPVSEGGAMEPGEEHLLLLAHPQEDGTLNAGYITLKRSASGGQEVSRIVMLGPVHELLKQAQ